MWVGVDLREHIKNSHSNNPDLCIRGRDHRCTKKEKKNRRLICSGSAAETTSSYPQKRACMDTAQWHQMGLQVKPSMEEMMSSTTAATTCSTRPQLMERRARPQKEQALNCPRCNSTNTKFCYYNNYSLTQPRYFCKACRRYWTEGGSLRNVPMGGGSRKNKRSSSSSTTTSSLTSSSSVVASSSKTLPADLTPPISSSNQNPKFHEGQDLNLAFPHHHMAGEFGDRFHNMENSNTTTTTIPPTCSPATSTNFLSAMELLRSGISARGVSPFMPMTIPEAGALYPAGFGLQDFRSTTLGFPLEGTGGGAGFGNMQGVVQEDGGRVLFPFEDLRQQVSSTTRDFEQNRGQGAGDSSGFWNGMIGGGGPW